MLKNDALYDADLRPTPAPAAGRRPSRLLPAAELERRVGRAVHLLDEAPRR